MVKFYKSLVKTALIQVCSPYKNFSISRTRLSPLHTIFIPNIWMEHLFSIMTLFCPTLFLKKQSNAYLGTGSTDWARNKQISQEIIKNRHLQQENVGSSLW